MGCCKKFCCCLWCPCCFCLGTLRAFALLGAFLALLVALAFGPAVLELPDEVSDICEAVAWFRDTELSYTVASTENLQAWAKGCHAAFQELQPEAQELLRNLQKTGRHRSEEDWRQGADWFESFLVDYDVASNWGNWIHAAGLTTGRVNRFNVVRQSKMYDKDTCWQTCSEKVVG
eukprot:s870_g10.t1